MIQCKYLLLTLNPNVQLVNNPNIDFVIEVLFSTSKDKHPSVRKSSLLSLDILHKKTPNDTVTYLKARHLLPFFYRCLNDKDKQVRSCALLCIQNFGPQGELMFIEGVTKDRNYQIRCECAQGLAQIGPTTFRTLLLALHDVHPAVRDAASQAILRHMNPEEVDDVFRDKDHQRQTIKCGIREVLTQGTVVLQHDIKTFLNSLMVMLENTPPMIGGTHIDGGNQFKLYGSMEYQQPLQNSTANKENPSRYIVNLRYITCMMNSQIGSYNQVRRPSLGQVVPAAQQAKPQQVLPIQQQKQNFMLFNQLIGGVPASNQNSGGVSAASTPSKIIPPYHRYM